MSISKFNIHAGFTAYKCITVHKLEPLLEKSYKTEGGIFVLCSKGSLKTIINHTEYRIRDSTSAREFRTVAGSVG